MTTSTKQLSTIVAAIVLLLGTSSPAWSATLNGLTSDYPACAKEGEKSGDKKGDKEKEEEPDCEE